MTDWEDKIKAFLHDPPSKALDIRTHKVMSEKLLGIWKTPKGNDELYDQISASADRPGVLGQVDDCSVNFVEAPELTHPISRGRLKLKLNKSDLPLIENNLVEMLDKMPLSEYNTDKSKFFTLMEGLKQNLSLNEPCLYSIWSKIPADTRIPDHSIWHHNGLVSALATCKDNPHFFIFSLGPVQGFISEARKLRDLWVGSVILSYLAWAGIRIICDTFGPDHIIYPSLSGQPFFSAWLQENHLTEIFEAPDKTMQKIASFPNKFVAILPKDAVEEIGKKIEDTIRSEWSMISESVYSAVKQWAGSNPEYFKAIWERQNENLWEFYWLASPWLKTLKHELVQEISESDKKEIKRLAKLFKESSSYDSNREILYSPSHAVAQSLQAALKNSRQFQEGYAEPGDKCAQCGKRQQLSISEDRDCTRGFWTKIEQNIGKSAEIKENERLCSICLIKRFIYRGINIFPSQLHRVFSDFKFPSSTEIAFNPIRRKLESQNKIDIWNDFITECSGEENAYDALHDNEEKKQPDSKVRKFYGRLLDEARIEITNILGKYYAILMMDGDRMGDLVNGKAEHLATWKDIMHSSLPEKLSKSPSKEKTKGWLKGNALNEKRHLTPSVHKAISEALGDFALNTVPYVIAKYHGHLIYAGGDDVLAVIPIDTVLSAAQEVMEMYRTPFLVKKADGGIKQCEDKDEYRPEKGDKLLIHLGEASTISAAVIIAHHKAPLRGLTDKAHRVLEREAKDKAGRDAIAISLQKRSGAEKLVARKWANEKGKSYTALLMELMNDLSDTKTSSRLIYKLDENKTALKTLAANGPDGSVEKLIESYIDKGQRDKTKSDEEWAKSKESQAIRLKAILFDDKSEFNADGLFIAHFLAQASGGE